MAFKISPSKKSVLHPVQATETVTHARSQGAHRAAGDYYCYSLNLRVLSMEGRWNTDIWVLHCNKLPPSSPYTCFLTIQLDVTTLTNNLDMLHGISTPDNAAQYMHNESISFDKFHWPPLCMQGIF